MTSRLHESPYVVWLPCIAIASVEGKSPTAQAAFAARQHPGKYLYTHVDMVSLPGLYSHPTCRELLVRSEDKTEVNVKLPLSPTPKLPKVWTEQQTDTAEYSCHSSAVPCLEKAVPIHSISTPS